MRNKRNKELTANVSSYNNYTKLQKKKERRREFKASMFILPSLIGVAAFFLIPYLVVIYYAFIDNPLTKEFVGFANFVNIIKNKSFKLAAVNTFKFSVIAVPLAVILSLLLAIVLEQKIPGKSRFRTFFLSPMMVPVASIVLIWQVFFHYNGVLNQFMLAWGFDKIDWFK